MTFVSRAGRAMLQRFLSRIWKTGRQPEKRSTFPTPHPSPSDQALVGTIVSESANRPVLTYFHTELWKIQTGLGENLLLSIRKSVNMEMIMEKQYGLIEMETFIDEFMRATGPAARRKIIRDHLKEIDPPWWKEQDQDENFTGERDGHV